jgi:hypothetical protein
MVPVGGAIIASGNNIIIDDISKFYPGLFKNNNLKKVLFKKK